MFRRILVFAFIGLLLIKLSAGGFGATIVPDIEIYNHGKTQVVILNRDGGVLVYKGDSQSNYDEFADRLWEYLERRKWQKPRYLVFFEPEYLSLHPIGR